MSILKKIVSIIIIATLVICCGCKQQKETKDMNSQTSIIAISDNQTLKDKLITKSYPINSWSDIALYGSTLEEVNQKFEIQCLRSMRTNYYAIFKSENYGWLYLLFSSEDGKYVVSDIWYYERRVYKQDFEKLILEKSTLADVREIDKFGNEILYASSVGPQSHHYTYDGYRIEIEYGAGDYGNNPKDFIVTNVEIELEEENSVIYNLLPIDKLK